MAFPSDHALKVRFNLTLIPLILAADYNIVETRSEA
jgi:hypothetical protein